MSKLADKIKEKERQKREEARLAAEALEKKPISFDEWFFLRTSKIPAQHRKEVIKVFFKSIGLKDLELPEDFDKAIKKYGIKID